MIKGWLVDKLGTPTNERRAPGMDSVIPNHFSYKEQKQKLVVLAHNIINSCGIEQKPPHTYQKKKKLLDGGKEHDDDGLVFISYQGD